MIVSGLDADLNVRVNSRLTAITSNLLAGFRKLIASLHNVIYMPNVVIQMCSIVYIGVTVNGKWPCFSTPAIKADCLEGCINGGTGKHLWDLYLGKVLNSSSLYVGNGGILILAVPFDDRTAKLHYNNHGHASFRPYQIQSFHSILPLVPASAMGQNQCMDRSDNLCCLLYCRLSHSVCVN